MPTIKLTQAAVDKLKAPKGARIEYWDNQLPGFGLRIAPSGRKSWVALYRVNGRLVRETIGTVGLIPNVAEARDRARESLRQVERGIHPIEARRASEEAAMIAEAQGAANTFNAVADRFVTEHVERLARPSTVKETKRIFDRDVRPIWGARPTAGITRQDVNDILDRVAGRGAMVQANETLKRLKTLFRWALDEEIIVTDPTAKVRKRAKEVARDRALTDDEIRLFWTGCDKLEWPFGPMFKLLLLTAQRRDEVATMEWRELDLAERRWTIPREKAKNDRTHEVHLSALALGIIKSLPKIGDAPRFVLTTNGRAAVSGFSRAKARLDGHMLELLQKEKSERGAETNATIAGWVLHDLRRTAATGMAKLNVAPHVVDRILNHVSGTIRGVAAVYNRHAYLEERKTALDAWNCYIETLVRPKPKNVVSLASTRG